MYTGLLHLHSGLRWLILLVIIVTIVKYFIGMTSHKAWGKADNVLGIVLTSFMDIQFLVGIVLYFFLSPTTQMAFRDFGAAMKNPDLRFYAVEHALLMLVAVVFVHVGRSLSKKVDNDRVRFSKGLLWFGLALIAIFIGIPWDRL